MGRWSDVRDGARDVYDIFRRARNVGEIVRAVIPRLGAKVVLNEEGEAKRMDAGELVAALKLATNTLRGHVDDKGKVDYRRLRATKSFEEVIQLAPALRHVTPEDLPTDDDRIAFFVNLYNVLSIHGVLAFQIDESVMEVPSFFGRVSYQVGDVVLSLDEMENGVLRRNAGHPATRRPTLADDSPAHAYSPSFIDPRIHMALVCASTSCPPVAFYDPDKLDDQLRMASANYVNTDVRVLPKEVRLPMIFRYYAVDWGGAKGIRKFLLEHADQELNSQLRQAFASDRPWVYDRYDWGLNASAR